MRTNSAASSYRQHYLGLSLGGGRKKDSFGVKVAIINFLCVHFTYTANLSLKGIIYSSLHRLLNSKVKDFGYCRACNTDDKAEKSALFANPPITLSPFFQQSSKGTFHQSQNKTIYNFKPLSDLLFPKGYALNLWVLPAFFFPVRTSLSGVLRTPTQSELAFTSAISCSAGSPCRRAALWPCLQTQKTKRKGWNQLKQVKELYQAAEERAKDHSDGVSVEITSCSKMHCTKSILTLSLQCKPEELLSLSCLVIDFLSSSRCIVKPRQNCTGTERKTAKISSCWSVKRGFTKFVSLNKEQTDLESGRIKEDC